MKVKLSKAKPGMVVESETLTGLITAIDGEWITFYDVESCVYGKMSRPRNKGNKGNDEAEVKVVKYPKNLAILERILKVQRDRLNDARSSVEEILMVKNLLGDKSE